MSDSADENQATPVGHVVLLGLCTALFALRVTAQLVQYASPTRFLPPFDAWQGSGLAYQVLLASQLLILVAMALGTGAVYRSARVRKSVGRWLVVLGAVYFGSMSAPGSRRLRSRLFAAAAALVHMALAGYVLTLGHYHSRRG
jgi:hypothetical protein